MPELPDVEIARRQLRRWLLGATITEARSTDRRILRPGSPQAFSRSLAGRKVRDIERRGKWLRIVLEDGTRVFSHLGMTGEWVARPAGSQEARSERARIDVERRGRPASVRYLDPRRFGRLVVEEKDIPEWLELGPDPLVDGLGAPMLAALLSRSSRPVKVALMDQTMLAGIGNILAMEALWRARIDPRSPADALSRADVGRLARALRAVLQRALEARQTSDGWGDAIQIYGRRGSPCPRCGARLERIVLGGRTTTFCARCQKRRKR